MSILTQSISKVQKEPQLQGQQIDNVIDAILPQFDSMMKTYVVFNAFFLSLGILEFIFLVFFFTFLAQSAVLATSLALVFLTFFSYFILKLYLQAKQPEQFQDVKQRYVNACKGILGYQEGTPEHYVALANACNIFAESLQNKQEAILVLPEWLDSLEPWLEKFTSWCQGQDVCVMKELLYRTAVEENIKLVKCAPTKLAAHASLANAYLHLSNFYKDLIILQTPSTEEIITLNDASDVLQKKFRSIAERAITEFKIITELSPDDTWAHIQLGKIYRDLKMPHEEIREHETILRITPEDQTALFRLGKLYFQQGWNAHGLRIYEQLKQKQEGQAEDLIQFYGSIEDPYGKA